MIEKLNEKIKEITEENGRLRAGFANSDHACIYCSLPSNQWNKCKSGFPGCERANDALGCPELGASLQLNAVQDKIQKLENN